MSAPMTLEEAVREVQADGFGMCSPAARAALLAHAKRTIAARSGEPEEVAAIRYVAKYHDMRRDVQLDRLGAMNVVEYLDTLTAELAAARAERDAYKRAKAENDDRFMGERDDARADRDRLAAMVERVRGVVSNTWSGFPGHVRAADILAALEAPNV
jgi:hypothetical protein